MAAVTSKFARLRACECPTADGHSIASSPHSDPHMLHPAAHGLGNESGTFTPSFHSDASVDSDVPPGAVAGDSVTQRGTEDRLATMADACTTLLKCIGEDPSREGLLKTPMRMAKALLALTEGYCQEPADVIGDALFESASDEMVLIRDIELFSMCEHHMLPFYGRAHVAYIPTGRVVGLSKVARLVNVYARRLQIQERLTTQIATAIAECVGAKSVAVMVDCSHMCMSMRGVEKHCASTVTTSYLGEFKTDRAVRAEFLAQLRSAGGKA